MERILIKRRLIDKFVETHKDKAMNSENAMNDLQSSANEYGVPKDRYDSHRAQLLRNRDLFAEKLHNTLAEIQALIRIDVQQKCESVKYGSLVITSEHKLFVSISLGKVRLDNDEYIAISPNVPLYKVMEGMKKGDYFEFNSKKIKILDICWLFDEIFWISRTYLSNTLFFNKTQSINFKSYTT